MADSTTIIDTTGREPFKGKRMKVDLIHFGVVGEKGDDLQPDGNPHEVSEGFGRSLIASGRAHEHKPKEAKAPEKPAASTSAPVVSRDPVATNSDPKVPANADPKAAPATKPTVRGGRGRGK